MRAKLQEAMVKETWRQIVESKPTQRVWVYAPEHLLESCLGLNSFSFERHRWLAHEDVVCEFQLGTCTVQARLYMIQSVKVFPTMVKSTLELAPKISPGDLYIDLTATRRALSAACGTLKK
jgi:hypothetical protein